MWYNMPYHVFGVTFITFLGGCFWSEQSVKASTFAPVAQLDRASDCGSEGRRFESCRAYQKKKTPLGLFLLLSIL